MFSTLILALALPSTPAVVCERIPLSESARTPETIRGVTARSNIGVNHAWDPAPNWWYDRFLEKQRAIRNAPNGEIDLLFVGDSITHNWEGARGPGSDFGGRQLAAFRKRYSVLDLGYGGDGTEQVLWRLSHGELDGFKTKCVMLLVGTNDACTPEMTAARIRVILDVIAEKQPQATTLLLAIFPSGEKADHPWRRRSQAVNRLIEKFADGEKVVWLDFGKRFLQPDGSISKEMMPDFLHPRQAGYDIWAEEVAPHFRRIVGARGGASADSGNDLSGRVSRAGAFEIRQIFRPERVTRGDVNLRPLQPIDGASWIWTDGAAFDDPRNLPVVRFRNRFASDGSKLVFDVSADPRYVLKLDGRIVSRGPHKGFLEHWYYQSYEVSGLTAGEHTLEAVVFHLGSKGPLSILSSGRGGFVLKAEGAYDARLTTGKGRWQAQRVPVMSYGAQTDPDTMTGSENIVRGTGILDTESFDANLPWQATFVVKKPVVSQNYGFHRKSWALFPTERPDEIERPCAPGAIRAARSRPGETNAVYAAGDAGSPWVGRFQNLLTRGERVVLETNASVRILWDLGNYYCGFPQLGVSRGAGSRIRWRWAEALYEPFRPAGVPGEIYLHKGNRNAFAGKAMARAMADTFLPDGRAAARFTTPWWKCGRWIELVVRTADEPLTLTELGIVESRSPLAIRSAFACDDASVDGIVRIATRGLECCTHEMFMDCPYFEQQMYPGDTRVEMLTLNTLSGDDRLLRYGIGIFDYSRRNNGMIRMNFPSLDGQDSSTYSMCWAMMLGDYALWHGANEFLRQRIPGLRQTLSQIDTYRNADGLLEGLPGWSFEDWSEPWGWFGVAPDGRFGCSAVDNLLYVYALRQAAFAERACGDAAMGDYWMKKAEAVAAAVRAKFWDEGRGIFADTLGHDRFSEHAQCLALLSDVVTGERASRAFNGLVTSADLAPTTVYFSHYLFDTYFKFARPDLFLKRLDLWRQYVRDGLKTPMEAPGKRGRSDCHAWGAHPLYHLQTGIAGIRPATAGFAKVLVAPQPGALKFVRAAMPTPKGTVWVDLRFDGGRAKGTVTLPEGLPGVFRWQGTDRVLKAGENGL